MVDLRMGPTNFASVNSVLFLKMNKFVYFLKNLTFVEIQEVTHSTALKILEVYSIIDMSLKTNGYNKLKQSNEFINRKNQGVPTLQHSRSNN